MMRGIRILFLLYFLFASSYVKAQDSIIQRVIFIGNAGEINSEQEASINSAITTIISQKTTVVFLGDNVLPNGFNLNSADNSKKILLSQYQGFRDKGVPVYFIPGDRDWDNRGPEGLEKITAEGDYLKSLGDSLLQLIPANGCPDPVAVNVSDSLAIIAFDSEWWLHQFDKSNPEADCLCSTPQEISDAMEDLIYKNRYKVILLVSHHPFQNQGYYGGHFPLKAHLFPLTTINRHLYIPLPVLGSLFVFYKKIFTTPQDIGHPLYKKMVNHIDILFPTIPNVIHVSAHEMGMQLIKGKQMQVVAGVSGKHHFLKKNRHALYLEDAPGFVTADLMKGNSLKLTYYIVKDGKASASFSYTQPYQSMKQIEDSALHVFDKDSIDASVFARFDSVNGVHRFLFGESYRKEWAANTSVPVLRMSVIKGGLTPFEKGGGQQTHSLRLKDKDGKEWVLRSIEKYPESLLPEPLKGTFIKTLLTDAISGENPYGSLMVPVLSDAENVPHTNPMIGYVASDTALGMYNRIFANHVCMLEEREPLGKSENTEKMLKKLNNDNANSVDETTFFRLRLLDLFMGDWDRHEGQWGWVNVSKDEDSKIFVAVPKDRDQAFSLNEGLFPTIASRKWIMPKIRGFEPSITAVDYAFFNGKYLNSRFLNQLSYEEWMNMTHEFVLKLNDSVLEASLQKLPKTIYNLSHDQLLATMKKRRANMESAMSKYYRILNKIVDINCSDKEELIEITDTADKKLIVSIYRISKYSKTILFHKIFDQSITKEIRIFTGKGNDSVLINNKTTRIKLRIVGGKGNKYFDILSSERKVRVYEKKSNTVIDGKSNTIIRHFSNDSLNTVFVPTNLYNVVIPLVNFGYNLDDGLLLGGGFKYIHQGFRKVPYGSLQQLSGLYSFSTGAFLIKYKGEWIRKFGKADLLILGNAFVPNNTQNYFGSGNETPIDKTGDYRKYYRARFNLYELQPALRWKNKKGVSFSAGPTIQYYSYDPNLNTDRFISTRNFIHTYDSTSIEKTKMNGGLALNFISDKRSNVLLPVWGTYIDIKTIGYIGLNSASGSFSQTSAEIDLYKSLNARSTIVLAERIGGAFTIGQPAFYQTVFLGGRENLMGFHQNRFSGLHMVYNNLELRLKLADFASYIVPGQLGLIGFYDVGRVWDVNDHSSTWHNGFGGGLYFAPARIIVLRLEAGYSDEGWYPYVAMGFRF